MARGSKREHGKWSRRRDASVAHVSPPREDPLADEARGDEPFDLAAVQRDDALLDALAGGGDVPATSDEEYRLASLLAGWRAEIVGPELPAGPTIDDVAAAVDRELNRQRSSRRGGLRLLRPVAGAAAAVAVVMAGATVFSYNAQPGDPLWRVKEVVFTERANSTVASIDTANNLEQAEQMIKAGDPQGAMTVLQSASQRVGDVSDSGKRDELNAWHDRLMADATKTTTAVPTTTETTPGLGQTTSSSVPPTTTLPGSETTTVPSVPPEILTAPVVPVVPTVPPVATTLPPVVPTTPIPPVTTTPSPSPEMPIPEDTGSATTTRLFPTSKELTQTRELVPDTSPSGG